MADNGAVTRSVLADQIKERLLEGIFDGSYPPDTRIVETALAKEFGTSQAPVREALRGLEALGVIEIQPFRGARVRRLDPEELVEAYTVRSAIESLGAKLAVPRMTDQDIAELVGLGKAMHQAARARDGLAVARIDAQLHAGLIERSGNRTLIRLWRSLEPLSRTYITLVVPGADPLWTAKLHDPILDALQRRDSRAVVKTLQRHFAEASEVLTARLAAAETTASAQPARPARPARATPGRQNGRSMAAGRGR
ncbi:MAG TPA: GntR family transcriptional regulator [Jiangellales bacterium]|nr:GntR family transcriptional regulator [Jiangellales bacterium]